MPIGNYHQQVGGAIAQAKLSAHSNIGVAFQFWHRIAASANNAGVQLVGKILSSKNELVEDGGIITEQRVLTMLISTAQAGFLSLFNAATPDIEPITQGDQMMYPIIINGVTLNPLFLNGLPQSRIYSAIDVVSDKWNTNYTVKWVEPKRLTAGRK